jgi:hypothetical protein
VRPPRVIFAEVKIEGGRLSEEQVARLARLKACPGVEAYTWRPRDWPDVITHSGTARVGPRTHRPGRVGVVSDGAVTS